MNFKAGVKKKEKETLKKLLEGDWLHLR